MIQKQEYSSDEKAKEIIKQADKAFKTSERMNIESTWQLLAEFILPNANGGFFGDTSKGVRKDTRVFNSIGIQANRDLASFLHAIITNPAMDWSKLRYRTELLNNDDSSVLWLQDCIRKIHVSLNESNFTAEIGEGWTQLCGLGTMALFHEEITDAAGAFSKFNFCTWHLTEIAYAENDLGIVDTIFRKFSMSLKQLYQKFGNAIGQDLLDKLENSPLQEYQLYHVIYPRAIKDKRYSNKALSSERPFASCYVLQKGQKLLKEDGYYEFPVYVPRWSTLPAEIYGYGPGHTVLGDVRSLNKIWQEGLKALSKAVNPPLYTSKRNMVQSDLRPGRINVVNDVNQIKEFVTQSRLDLLQFSIENLTQTIKAGFYIDKLLLPPRTETGEMTAYEVAQRLEQLQQILGPVVSRFNDELLTPLIMRSFKILLRNGIIDPPPPMIQQMLLKQQEDIDVEVVFINNLARSQQLSELRNVQNFVQESAGMAQLNPQILDKINFDEVLEYSARIRNIPEQILRSDEEVQAQRQQQQQMAQMQQSLNAGEQIGNIMGKVSPYMKNNQEEQVTQNNEAKSS